MKSLNNYFHIHDSRRQVIADRGEFVIEDGIIKPIAGKYLVGQYIRIVGSIMNDGIFQIERVGDGYIDVAIHSDDYPAWIQPSVWPDTTYSIGARVTHNNARWISLVDSNQWEPGAEPWAWEKVGVVEHSLRDEVFSGVVCPLRVPREFVALSRTIENYANLTESDPKQALLIAESFGGYSYSKATDSNGIPPRWQQVFNQALVPYRNRMFVEKII